MKKLLLCVVALAAMFGTGARAQELLAFFQRGELHGWIRCRHCGLNKLLSRRDPRAFRIVTENADGICLWQILLKRRRCSAPNRAQLLVPLTAPRFPCNC